MFLVVRSDGSIERLPGVAKIVNEDHTLSCYDEDGALLTSYIDREVMVYGQDRTVEPLIEAFRKKGGAGLDAAKGLADAYKSLLALAPKNVYVRNNLGFVLRDVVTMSGKRNGEMTEVDGKALPLLKESQRVYDEATSIIGELRPEITVLPYETRYAYAQIINDTGLMFWYYPTGTSEPVPPQFSWNVSDDQPAFD